MPSRIDESDEFVQLDKLFGYPGPTMIENTVPVRSETLTYPPFPPSINGLDAQSSITLGNGSTTVFYSSEPPDGISFTDFYESGGITFGVRDFGREGHSAMGALSRGQTERNQPIAVGERNALLGWDDPEDERLIRPHRVFWTNHRSDFWLRANVPAADAVRLARQVVCSTKDDT